MVGQVLSIRYAFSLFTIAKVEINMVKNDSSKKSPRGVRPDIIPSPIPIHNLVTELMCPVCNDWMIPYTVELEDKGKPVRSALSSFRCPTCKSTFNFSSEAEKIVEKTQQ